MDPDSYHQHPIFRDLKRFLRVGQEYLKPFISTASVILSVNCMSDIIELLKEQRELELSHVEKLKPTVETLPDRLVSAMLESIIHDSRKHATLCQALVDVEAGAVPLMLDTDMATALRMAQAVKQHIRVEADMINRLESMLEKVEDDRVADILRYILADERRHHAVLTRMSALLDRDDTAYDEYLELAQKYMFVSPDL